MSLSTQEIDDANGQSWSQVADRRLLREYTKFLLDEWGDTFDRNRSEDELVDEFMARRNQSSARK